jgi:hypothetical protein
MTSADCSLRSSLHARRPFRRQASSPQVRVVNVPAQPLALRRHPLVARASRTSARSPWMASPPIHRTPFSMEGGFLFVGSRFRYRFFQCRPDGRTGFPACHLASCSGSLRPAPPEDFHLLSTPMLGTRWSAQSSSLWASIRANFLIQGRASRSSGFPAVPAIESPRFRRIVSTAGLPVHARALPPAGTWGISMRGATSTLGRRPSAGTWRAYGARPLLRRAAASFSPMTAATAGALCSHCWGGARAKLGGCCLLAPGHRADELNAKGAPHGAGGKRGIIARTHHRLARVHGAADELAVIGLGVQGREDIAADLRSSRRVSTSLQTRVRPREGDSGGYVLDFAMRSSSTATAAFSMRPSATPMVSS